MLDALLLPLLFSMGLNWLMFIPAFLFKTDKLTDLSYSLTFVSIAIYGFYISEKSVLHITVFTMILMWSIRLGAYLFHRIHKMGRDKRFDEMRSSIPRFLGFWTLQGITVFIVSIPSVLLFHGHLTKLHPATYFGAAIFLLGLVIESVADWQKFKFKSAGNEKWIETGLWKKIRHPNYLGEILVWIGIYTFCSVNLPVTEGLVSLISPVFIIILLKYVSGIPLLERSAMKKYGDDPDYRKYVENTSRLIPNF